MKTAEAVVAKVGLFGSTEPAIRDGRLHLLEGMFEMR